MDTNENLESVRSMSYGSTTNPRVNLGAESPSFLPTTEAGGESGQRMAVRQGSLSAVSSPNSSPGTSAARMEAARGLGFGAPSDATSLDHAHTLQLQPSYRTGPNTVLNPQSSDSSVNSQNELLGGQRRAAAAVSVGGDEGDEHQEVFA